MLQPSVSSSFKIAKALEYFIINDPNKKHSTHSKKLLQKKMRKIRITLLKIIFLIPLESREVATMLEAEPNAFAKDSAKEKSPSPTSSIL
jgi:hypothetical protein